MLCNLEVGKYTFLSFSTLVLGFILSRCDQAVQSSIRMSSLPLPTWWDKCCLILPPWAWKVWLLDAYGSEGLCPVYNRRLALESAEGTTALYTTQKTLLLTLLLVMLQITVFGSELIYETERPKTRARCDIESIHWHYVWENDLDIFAPVYFLLTCRNRRTTLWNPATSSYIYIYSCVQTVVYAAELLLIRASPHAQNIVKLAISS